MKKNITREELIKLLKEKMNPSFKWRNDSEFIDFLQNKTDSYYQQHLSYNDFVVELTQDIGYPNFNVILSKYELLILLELLKDYPTYSVSWYDDEEDQLSEDITNIDDIKWGNKNELEFSLLFYDDLEKLFEIMNEMSLVFRKNFVVETAAEDYMPINIRISIDQEKGVQVNGEYKIENASQDNFLGISTMFFDYISRELYDLADMNGFAILIDSECYNLKFDKNYTGKDILNEIEYAGRKDIFSSKQSTMSYIKRYPILIQVVPEIYFRDKDIIEAFIISNAKLLNSEDEIMKEHEEQNIVFSSSIIQLKNKNARDNALVQPINRFQYWMNDEGIVRSLLENGLYEWVKFNENSYNSFDYSEILTNYPEFIYSIFFSVWDFQKNNPIFSEVIEKYQLETKSSIDKIASYFIIDLLMKHPEKLKLLCLIHDDLNMTRYPIKIAMKSLSYEEQKQVLMERPLMIEYIKNQIDPFDPIVDYVINNYVNPQRYLSDETIVVRNLLKG
jgi:hypothetical protein